MKSLPFNLNFTKGLLGRFKQFFLTFKSSYGWQKSFFILKRVMLNFFFHEFKFFKLLFGNKIKIQTFFLNQIEIKVLLYSPHEEKHTKTYVDRQP